MTELLHDFPTSIEIPVRWGDMDAFQHVNNTVYFRYFEIARINYFEHFELSDFLSGTAIGPILASIGCRFRFPVTYPDTVIAAARVVEIQEDRLTMQHKVVSKQHGVLAAEGEGLIVTYNYQTKQKAPIPDAVRRRIIAIEEAL